MYVFGLNKKDLLLLCNKIMSKENISFQVHWMFDVIPQYSTKFQIFSFSDHLLMIEILFARHGYIFFQWDISSGIKRKNKILQK